MYSSLATHRVTTAIAGLLIAGSGVLAATPALAAAPVPGAGSAATASTSTATTGPATSSTATPSAGGATSTAAQPQKPATEPTGRVVSRLPLTIRQKATTNSRALGSLQPGAVVALHCKVVGQNVDGNNRWYRLGAGRSGYVAARYVQNLATVPWC
jgi:uncharacterized protein YgiM (DUF1202 family)